MRSSSHFRLFRRPEGPLTENRRLSHHSANATTFALAIALGCSAGLFIFIPAFDFYIIEGELTEGLYEG